jgi:hypothetical protein
LRHYSTIVLTFFVARIVLASLFPHCIPGLEEAVSAANISGVAHHHHIADELSHEDGKHHCIDSDDLGLANQATVTSKMSPAAVIHFISWPVATALKFNSISPASRHLESARVRAPPVCVAISTQTTRLLI